MPQPLTAMSLRGPGRFGLNISQAVGTEDPRWALELTNAVFDDAGRMAARNGRNNLTTTGGHSSNTLSVHEYVKDKDTKEILSAAGNVLYEGTETLTDVTGAITTPTNDDWKMVNFNGKCIAVQQGHAPIVYTGTTFSTITGTGSPPNGNDALAAWGRCWIVDEDRLGISWSALLDETTWSGAGTGNIALENYWPDGLDIILAIAEWQDRLLVFGERSVLVFVNPDDIASSPSTFALDDTLTPGVVGRDAVTAVGNDLVYLSREGLRTITRAIQYESLPAALVSRNVRDQLAEDIASSSDYRMCYSETVGGIIAKVGIKYWYFDAKSPTPTQDFRASQWTGIGWTACHAATDGTVYFGDNGGIADYSGFSDDGTAYLFRYRGTWLDNNGRTIIPKRARVGLVTSTQMNVSMVWAFDFIDQLSSETKSTGATATVSEWNSAEWGLDEWSGAGTQVKRLDFNLSGEGERVQLGLTIPIAGGVSIEQIDAYSKVGRIAA